MRQTLRLALALGAVSLALVVWAPSVRGADDPPRAAEKPTAEGLRFFESKIRPLLAERCYKCHGPAKQESGLRLDTRSGILEGGNAGPAVVPGKPGDSLLLTAVSYDDADLKMPPDRKLSAGPIADLKRWVEMGAPHPDAAEGRAGAGRAGGVSPLISRDPRDTKDLEAARTFWAFQPPRDPPPPAVRDVSWPSGPLDRFVLAALEARGLKPAQRADKRTLIRRVTLDLIGLPPTPEEVDAFLCDESPQAFANVVERLLASPRYGERWGRHWLDVARYADSNGLDENICHGNAWRYRDYVVAALNADKPFDQFVLEQLAGDLLPTDDQPVRHERLIATGFLSLGPKVLAEPDKTKMEMDIIDEQVDTVGRALLGLTLGCARCHDHKFDPIPTEDYYALAGIFKSTRTMETFTTIARWNENPIATPAELARKAEHDKLLAAKQAEIDRVTKEAAAKTHAAPRSADTAANAVAAAKTAEGGVSAARKARLEALKSELEQLKKSAPEMTTAMGMAEGKVTDLRVHVRGSHLTLGDTAPRGFPRVLLRGNAPGMDAKQSGRLQLAHWLVRRDHPLTARVMANRIWRWHFGQGLVRSPDNFGLLGERPTNQPLLDWLAHRFMASGWSIKAMHRLIVLSSTYQMSSTHNAAAAAVDPDNILQWRCEVRRLEAETLRDALLAVSGSLDPQMGGSLVHVKNREFFFDHTSKDTTNYDNHRRSVYLPVVRNHLYDVFQLFDFGDGTVLSGHRTTSTVAPQALFMMNSNLVLQSSEQLADRLLASDVVTDAARIAALYSRTLGRPPTRQEVERAAAFLGRVEPALSAQQTNVPQRRRQAWRLLCQSVLASNEFLYVR